MRRFIAILTAVLLLAALAGCAEKTNTEPSETTAPTEAPTEVPYLDAQLDEPEWTLAEGELKLEDSDNIYAEGGDILYFAIVTADDGAQELRFRFNEETTDMLTRQSPDNAYYITLDGEKIGNAVLSDDCTFAIVTAENASGEITALASKIRGLTE